MTTPSSPPDPDLLLYPRLTRFYGLSYAELERLPRAMVRIYLQQYVELQAEEQLHAIQAATYPYMGETERARVMRYLARRAEPTNDVTRVDPTATDGARTLAGIGIAVKVKE